MDEDKPFEHNNFKYTEQGIEYPNSIKFPRYLFKYYAINSNSLDSFVNEYLFFSHPNQLNDVVDATDLLLNFEDCSEENYYGLYKYRTDRYNFDKNKIPNYEDAKKDDFRDLREFIYFVRFFSKGILSLTIHPYNKLMMAHYTFETGFVLEFEPNMLMTFLEKQIENKNVQLFPMNYSETIKPINFFKESKKTIKKEKGIIEHSLNFKIPFLYISSLKDEIWKYEEEWRILIEKDNMGHIAPLLDFRKVPKEIKIDEGRKIKYDNSCINKIILAPMFFNNSSFKSEISSNSYDRNYSLNREFFQKKELLDSMRYFLNKICSIECKGKVFIQCIDFCSHLKYERILIELLDLDFSNDVISFKYSEKAYNFNIVTKS